MRRWWWGILAVACGGETDPAPVGSSCLDEPLALIAGVGDGAYAEVAPGDALRFVHGPQGGWHVAAGGFVEHAEPDVIVQATVSAASLGDVPIVDDEEWIGLVYDDPSCSGTFYGVNAAVNTDRGRLSGQDLVCALDGEPLRYELTVSDFVGTRSTTAGVDVVAALDEIDVPTCDRPSVAVGSGSGDAFVAFRRDDPIPILRDDAGWHLELGGRVRRSGPEITVEVRAVAPGVPSEGAALAAAAEPIALAGYDPTFAGGEGTFSGLIAPLDTDQGPLTGQDLVCRLAGEALVLEVTVTDGSRGTASVTVEGVGTLSPDDLAACDG